MASAEHTVATASREDSGFSVLSSQRLLALAGIGMILAGMIFGDIFAIFVLHQNAARVGSSLTAAANAAIAGNTVAVQSSFRDTGAFLENRGTKVDTHVHLIAFGYLALMLALVQPWIELSERIKRRTASLFIFGGVLLPLCVFLIHYIGLAYSPLQAIGWASILADTGGLLVLLATIVYLLGLVRRFKSTKQSTRNELIESQTGAGRLLLGGGLLLILIGFMHGAYYAGTDLYRHEEADFKILSRMRTGAMQQDPNAVNQALVDYGQLQGDKAVKIAAHAHLIEFGFLAMLLAFFQPYVALRELWRKRWGGLLLLGSALLPVCVLLEMKFGLIAGGLADLGGLLVIIALLAMWIGILRYTGKVDLSQGALR